MLRYFFFLFFFWHLSSNIASQPTIRAVVVGVSEYDTSSNFPALQYAHCDAQRFASYLQMLSDSMQPSEKIGEGEEESRIQLLLDKDVSRVSMILAIEKLVKDARTGDKVFIYFSGHGAAETLSESELGYLIPPDCLDHNYSIWGYPLYHLNAMLGTLTAKGVKTFVLTDACRSGKLDNDNNGANHVSIARNNHEALAIKLMSCKENENSEESKLLGSGVFTHFVMEGLAGSADLNFDEVINFKELKNYVRQEVMRFTNYEQEPQFFGADSVFVGFSNPRLLQVGLSDCDTLVKDSLSNQDWVLARASMKKKGARPAFSPANQSHYKKFQAALNEGKYLGKDGAEGHFQRLKQSGLDSASVNRAKWELIGALLQKTQEGILGYLRADSSELIKRLNTARFSSNNANARVDTFLAEKKLADYESYPKNYYFQDIDPSYYLYPGYLATAAQLIGEEHVLFAAVKAQQLYFEGVLKRLNAARTKVPADFYLNLIRLQQQALALQPEAAYIYNELGLLFDKTGQWEKAKFYFRLAHRYARKWVLPINNLAGMFFRTSEIDSVLFYSKWALQLDPEFYGAHYNLGKAALRIENFLEAENHLTQAFQLNQEDFQALFDLAGLQYRMMEYAWAERLFYEAELRLGELMFDLGTGGRNLAGIGTGESLEEVEQKHMDAALIIGGPTPPEPLIPNDISAWLARARHFAKLKDEVRAYQMYKKVLEIDPLHQEALEWVGNFAYQQSDFAAAETYLKPLYQAVQKKPSTHAYFLLNNLYADWYRTYQKEQLFLEQHAGDKGKAIRNEDILYSYFSAFLAQTERFYEAQFYMLQLGTDPESLGLGFWFPFRTFEWRLLKHPEKAVGELEFRLNRDSLSILPADWYLRMGEWYSNEFLLCSPDPSIPLGTLYPILETASRASENCTEWLSKAIYYFEKALPKVAEPNYLHWKLAKWKWLAGDKNGAYQHLKLLQKKKVLPSEARSLLGFLEVLAGKPAQGESIIQRSLLYEIIPDQMLADFALRSYFFADASPEVLESYLEKALKTNPSDARYYFAMARLQLQKGATQRAMEYLKETFERGLEIRLVFKYDPVWAPLYDNPDFQDLLELKAPKYPKLFRPWP